MELVKGIIMAMEHISQECATIGNWFNTQILEINGVSITPLTIILPSTLLLILGIVIFKFLL